MGMLQSEKMALYAWTACPAAHDRDDQRTDGQFSQCSPNNQLTDLTMANDFMVSQSGPFLLSMSCQMLTSMLVSALKSKHSTGTTYGLTLSNRSCVKNIAGNLLWDLCNITPRMLLQSREHRSSAISFLLPFIFRAFASEHLFEVLVHGQMHRLYRKHFLNELWKCCRALFSLGSVERRDAYTVLSLYLSFFSCTNGFKDVSVDGGEEEFDLRLEKEFWDETKRGLVDKEGLVRKQSLHILKTTVWLSDESQSYINDSGSIPDRKTSISTGLTKRGRWAEKEAQSLGVGRIYNSNNLSSNNEQKWGAFFLLYEMLEEYGTHLVEAAWNHQVTLLLNSSVIFDNSINSNCGGIYSDQMGTLVGIFKWLAVLWDRGFCHDNPQVRFLIMQSFLGIEWKNYGNCSELVPEGFVLGPFLHGLNDPVHHKDFGLKGVYTSKTIAGATNFLSQYTSSLDKRKQITFLSILASCAKKHSFGRAGLMALVECIASAACGFQMHQCSEVECCKDVLEEVNLESASESCYQKDKVDFLDILRFIIESSKQHFNRSYRHQVCEKIVDAAVLVISALEMPLEILLYFISAIPREFSNCSGSLKAKLQEWLSHSDQRHFTCHGCTNNGKLLVSLSDFPKTFITCHKSVNSFASYDDEDVDAWASEASRWARVIFLVINEEHLDPILMFIQTHGVDICKQRSLLEWEPVKFLILILSLLQEIQLLQERTSNCRMRRITKSDLTFQENDLSSDEFSIVFDKFYKSYLSILEELVSFTNLSCSIFWSNVPLEDKVLPSSIRGKLGGPSQRRLSSTATTTVLQAITSMRTVTSISCWCTKFRSDVSLYSAVTSLWKLSLKMISSPVFDSEIEAEICLAAFEALAYALNALVDVFSPLALNIIIENDKSLSDRTVGKSLLDSFVLTFIHKVSDLVAVGKLVRTRRAILMNWKWICIEALLSIPKHDLENGVHIDGSSSFFSDSTIRWIFGDLVDGLENAGEGSILPMLRSIRLIFELFALGKMVSVVSSWHGVDLQMMWKLVQSAWVLHVSCNKRRVAPIAALLSSVLHNSVFSDEDMHQSDNASGPLKWFTEKILEEGTRSPRTIRLAALHLTGLWLANPNIIKYYMKELKLLTMYGSVAFDEDFKGELTDNHDAKCEVSVLAKSPDPELTEEFINTELYARVSVAVLFYEMSSLADTLGSGGDNKASERHESGKMFLLELLYSVVNEKDLSKELYKKYSAIHRRKIRAWQMICILAHFVDQDIIQEVTHSLYTSLHRNNLPSVRQYMETFLIHIYLKFPWLVGEQLVPLLRNYDMRPQALSSYVFVAANIILHSTDGVQLKHLDDLFPPIISLLTSHHHTLRGFTQLLVYQVLQKLLPTQDHGIFKMLSLEKRCLEDLKSYLSDNSDCARLRASMEGYLDAFDPKISITPAGIFYNRVENVEFECVPTSLMDRVIFFLNDTREDLRSSMAKDAVTLKNERMQTDEDTKCRGTSGVENEVELSTHLPVDISLDFQKKFTFSKKDGGGIGSTPFLGSANIFESLLDMEKEDQLIEQLLHSRTVALEELRASRQHFILVASFLDRIPNLAGLARTCEVFKASALAIADKSILHDKQFQLISVTAERWVPTVEVPVNNVKIFLEKMKREGFSILGLEQTANSVPLDQYNFPEKTVMVLGREKEGIPVEIIHILDVCIEIPQLGVVRSLNVHVSGAIALWEYTRQQRSHQLRY